MKNRAITLMSFEAYAEWARSRYPGLQPDSGLTPAEESVYGDTVAPVSSEECPVTLRSARGHVIVKPVSRRSV